MKDGFMEVGALVATCLALALMFLGEHNMLAAGVFAGLAVGALLLLAALLHAGRRDEVAR